ncbi:hypothetical protein A2U01_0081111 [Trifolium medium]|uniref:Uncharacterized protein n=1 Tax=Trifolium medium TaxID=97028 RepID=A0A392TIC5_9FABA|nr:hypothetical protein [Trifolium medium]
MEYKEAKLPNADCMDCHDVRSSGTAVTVFPEAFSPSVVSVTDVWSSVTAVTVFVTLDL